MTKVIDAVYEGGLFRPSEKVDLTEGARVQVLVPSVEPERDPKKVAEVMAAVAATAPRTGKPEDGARNHDKYLYSKEMHP